jgi:hypothetical protein
MAEALELAHGGLLPSLPFLDTALALLIEAQQKPHQFEFSISN